MNSHNDRQRRADQILTLIIKFVSVALILIGLFSIGIGLMGGLGVGTRRFLWADVAPLLLLGAVALVFGRWFWRQ